MLFCSYPCKKILAFRAPKILSLFQLSTSVEVYNFLTGFAKLCSYKLLVTRAGHLAPNTRRVPEQVSLILRRLHVSVVGECVPSFFFGIPEHSVGLCQPAYLFFMKSRDEHEVSPGHGGLAEAGDQPNPNCISSWPCWRRGCTARSARGPFCGFGTVRGAVNTNLLRLSGLFRQL